MSRGAVVGVCVALALAGAAAFVVLRSTAPAEPPAGDGVVRGEDATSPSPTALEGRGSAEPASTPEAPASAGVAPPAAGRGVLVVRVVASPAGEAVAGADVLIREAEEKVLARKATGPDGVARFDGLPGDRVEVLLRAPGRASARTSVSDLRLPGERSVTVTLEPGVSLSGSVLAATSRGPVPGARVVARIGGSVEGISTSYHGPPLDETETDRLGRFRVHGVPLGKVVSVVAEAPGFVPGSRSLMLGEGSERHPDLEIVLDPAAAATGRVVGPGGRAIQGADVHALSADEAEGDAAAVEGRLGPWGTGLRAERTARTDSEGRFVVDGLRVGAPYRFFTSAPGHARSPVTDPPDVARGPGRMPGRDLRLREAATLLVAVEDGEGRPLEAARVDIDLRSTTLAPEREGGGRHRFDRLPPGEHVVLASAPGFVSAAPRFTLAEGERREERLVLERGVAIEGTVVDDRGRPVAGAGVSAVPTEVPPGAARTRRSDGSGAVTDAGGRFRVEGLARGRHRVRASAAGHGPAEAVDAEAPGSGVRLFLRRSGTLRLRLVPPRGVDPPARLAVSVQDLASGSGSGSTRDWEDGRVVEEDAGPGRVELVVSAEGFAPVVREEEVGPGEDRDLGEVPLDRGVGLVGRVADLAGEPVAGARVRVAVPGFLESSVGTTGADGRYRVSLLPRGEFAVHVGADGYLAGRASVALSADSTSLDLTLARPVAIRGSVRDAEGRGVGGVRVGALLEEEAPAGIPRGVSEWTEDSGAFELAVAAGRHRLEVRDREGTVLLRREEVLSVPPEATVPLVLPR